jgi:hypothetical protein
MQSTLELQGSLTVFEGMILDYKTNKQGTENEYGVHWTLENN